MNEYEIITKNKFGKSTFLTKGRSPKSALRNLINRSADFKMLSKDNTTLNIIIKILK